MLFRLFIAAHYGNRNGESALLSTHGNETHAPRNSRKIEILSGNSYYGGLHLPIIFNQCCW
jgi:hypothetical protein